MTDAELADVLIERLNSIISDPKVREDIGRLIEERILVGEMTAAHPSVQIQQNAAGDDVLGFLGLLNGVVGTISDGKRKGWGFVAAVFDSSGRLRRFCRTDAGT